jgi:hypothetical protein
MIEDRELIREIEKQFDAFGEKWDEAMMNVDDESVLFTKLQRYARDLRWALEEIEWKKVRTFHR